MLLFVCSSPFQIMNAINLSMSTFKDEEKVIYILDHAVINYKYYEEIKKTEVFTYVLFIQSKYFTGGKSTIKIIRYMKTAYHFINKKKIISQLNSDSSTYEKIFISSPDIPSQIIYYYYKEKFKEIELYMFEEGTLAYNYFNIKVSYLKKLFKKLLFRRDIMSDYVGGYVYKPEYVENKSNYEIIKIPNIDKSSNKLITVLNKIMDYKISYSNIIDTDYIFFDQAFQFNKTIDKSKQVLKFIIEKVGRNRITVKLHPRTNVNTYNVGCNIISVSVPYELIALNTDMKNKVLISHSSSVCFNPKILFNEEPFVILLYNLVDDSTIPNFTNEIDVLAKKIKNSYTNSNRFFIPQNYDELGEILKSIKFDNISLKD